MQDKSSLTIFIIIVNGEAELLNKCYGHRADTIMKLLNIICLPTIVTL
jgi:hypothetical protein